VQQVFENFGKYLLTCTFCACFWGNSGLCLSEWRRGAGWADAGGSYASLFKIAPDIRPTHAPHVVRVASFIDGFLFMRHDGMISLEVLSMLKEVGASGQISLGKKYAGQLFDMQIAADGSVTLTPVKVVPVAQTVREELAVYKVEASDAATPGSPTTKEWASAHAAEIDQYNQWANQREPYSQRVRRWRTEAQTTGPTETGNR
jgi:hypothetical protein